MDAKSLNNAQPLRVLCGAKCDEKNGCNKGYEGKLLSVHNVPTYPAADGEIVSGYYGACMTNLSTNEEIGGGAYPVVLERPRAHPDTVQWVGGDAVCDSLAPWFAGCGETSGKNLKIMFKNAPYPGSTVNFFPGATFVPDEACGKGCTESRKCMKGKSTACGHDGHRECTLFETEIRAGKAVACVVGQQGPQVVGDSFEVSVAVQDESKCTRLPQVGAWSQAASSTEDFVVIASEVGTSVSYTVGVSAGVETNLCDPSQCSPPKCTLGNATGKANRSGETTALISNSAHRDGAFGTGVSCTTKVSPSGLSPTCGV